MVIALIGSIIVLILIDIRGLFRNDQKAKTIIVYFFLMVLGFVISLLLILDAVSQSPSDLIESIVDFVMRR